MTGWRPDMDSLMELEESIAGKPGAPWVNPGNNASLSGVAVLLAVLLSVYGGMLGPLPTPNGFFELISQAEAEGASASNANLFAGISALLIAFAWWVTLTALIKWTPGKARTTALLGIATSWIIFVAVRGLGHFVLVEAEWEVVWANRVLVIVGQWMTEQMTQSPGSPQCIDLSNCYGNNQNWRLWWVLYPTFAVIAAAYGTTGDKPARFLVPFTFVSLLMVLIAWTPIEVNYHREVPVSKLAFAMLVAYATYGVSYYYCLVSEEYKANRLRSYIAVAAVATFFFAIFIMDPPEIAKKAAGWLSDNGLGMFGKVSEQGVQASQWGGLFVNLIVATAGCVLGFGVGVVLAFGRQSDLPFFSVPSVAIIELVRSGPLICWLWFAVFLMPDLIDPFYDAEDIMRMLLIFGLFGGCYIAEVLRGGLQAVDSGQKEAAAALGLTPFQTKMQVELPNAVRTTLPSIVSVFIGLWKDTTLLFIINILDFFKLAKDLPNTDIRFLGDFLEPIYVTAVVFWAFAFYLSRVSMRIEKNLGLVKEGGGEIA